MLTLRQVYDEDQMASDFVRFGRFLRGQVLMYHPLADGLSGKPCQSIS